MHFQTDLVFLPRWVQQECEHKSQQWRVSFLPGACRYTAWPDELFLELCVEGLKPQRIIPQYKLSYGNGSIIPSMPLLLTVEWMNFIFVLILNPIINFDCGCLWEIISGLIFRAILLIFIACGSNSNDYLLCMISVPSTLQNDILVCYYKIPF